MKHLLKYHDSDYFNEEDYYLLLDPSFDMYYVTKLHMFNGKWYCNNRLQFKAHSVQLVNTNELIGMELTYQGLTGKLCEVTNDAFGVYWYRGVLPSYWNDPTKLLK